MTVRAVERCSWCDTDVDADGGYRASERPGDRRACFCRLEHLVPWVLRGPAWAPGEADRPQALADEPATCARCGETLGVERVLLVRHRGQHRITDGFCSVDHMAAWAKAGGRWG